MAEVRTKERLTPLLLLLIIAVLFIHIASGAGTWTSKTIMSSVTIEDSGDTGYVEIVNSTDDQPNFGGGTSKYSAEITVTSSTGLEGGETIICHHSNDGSTDWGSLGTADVSCSPPCVAWINSTGSVLYEVDGDGTREWIRCDDDTMEAGESVTIDLRVLFENDDDTTNPIASLGSEPVPGHNDSDGSIEFGLKCSDDFKPRAISLWGDWSSGWHANRTNSTPANDTLWRVTVNGIGEGEWRWGAWCNDTAGNENRTDNRTFTVDLTDPQIGSRFMNATGTVYVNTTICLNVSGISDANLDSVWAAITQSNGTYYNVTMSDTGSCGGSGGDGWYSADVITGNSAGVFCYNATYANDSSGRISSNGTALSLWTGHTYYHPTDTTTYEYSVSGSESGDISGGDNSGTDENLTYTHPTWGKRLVLEGLFSQGDANTSSLRIEASSGKTAVNLTGVTGTGPTHTIFVPNNLNSGVYVCPGAKTLDHVNQSCPDIERFSYSEASAGTTRNGIKVEIDGDDYRISGLSGSGSGENAYLEVDLITPLDGLNVAQNTTFTVNATVFCRNGTCSNVSGFLRYNDSSPNPETDISESAGDSPFYITLGENPANCSTNPLGEDEFCNLTWTVNATGDPGTAYELGVLFESNDTSIAGNHTENSTLKIVSCVVDVTLQWDTISFGSLVPGDVGAATGNDGDTYNITAEATTTCNLDIYVKGTDLENNSLGYTIGVDNLTWNNVSNDQGSSHSLSGSWMPVKNNVAPSTNTTTWYWLSMPNGIASGIYSGDIEIRSVETGDEP